MGRKIDVEDLVGAEDIAKRLKLKRVQVVHTWISRYADFPRPVKVLGEGGGKEVRVWAFPDVAVWFEQHVLTRANDGRVSKIFDT